MASPDKTPPLFVDGIGPPLSQIVEDYEGERTTAARDVLALVAEVVRLRQERDEEKALRMRLMEAVDVDRGVVERLREALWEIVGLRSAGPEARAIAGKRLGLGNPGAVHVREVVASPDKPSEDG